MSAHQRRCGGRFIRPIPWYPPSRNRRYGVFLAVCAGVHSTASPRSTSKRFLLFVMSSPHIPLFLGAEVVLAADKLRSIDVPWSMSLANSWRGYSLQHSPVHREIFVPFSQSFFCLCSFNDAQSILGVRRCCFRFGRTEVPSIQRNHSATDPVPKRMEPEGFAIQLSRFAFGVWWIFCWKRFQHISKGPLPIR